MFVLAIIPKEHAQSVVDSLVEQEFPETSISLLALDTKWARNIIKDGGPLQKIPVKKLPTFLAKHAVTGVATYTEALAAGKTLIAVVCTKETQASIRETLQDNTAQAIIVVH